MGLVNAKFVLTITVCHHRCLFYWFFERYVRKAGTIRPGYSMPLPKRWLQIASGKGVQGHTGVEKAEGMFEQRMNSGVSTDQVITFSGR